MNERFFNLAIILSFVFHVVMIAGLSILKQQLKKECPPHRIEVVYKTAKSISQQKPPKKAVEVYQRKEEKKPQPVKEVKVFSKDELMKPKFKSPVKDVSRIGNPFHPDDKMGAKGKMLDVERKISVPFLESEKISNPQYLTYNQTIRQKIMQRAYNYVEHPDFQNGEVYLTFILSSDGQLRDIKIIEEKTHANTYLREVGLRSVQEAGPFSPFPKDLNYPELTFNVIISFEVAN